MRESGGIREEDARECGSIRDERHTSAWEQDERDQEQVTARGARQHVTRGREKTAFPAAARKNSIPFCSAQHKQSANVGCTANDSVRDCTARDAHHECKRTSQWGPESEEVSGASAGSHGPVVPVDL